MKLQKKAWEAAIPVYNAIVLLKNHRTPLVDTLLFIPIINHVSSNLDETLRSFGKQLDTFFSYSNLRVIYIII
jgi:signal peptidase I